MFNYAKKNVYVINMYSPVVWGNAPVQHIKLPGDSVRRLSHDAYVAAFPSEVEDIHGLVYIGSIPSAVQSGVLVGDVQYISKHWSTPLSHVLLPSAHFSHVMLYSLIAFGC